MNVYNNTMNRKIHRQKNKMDVTFNDSIIFTANFLKCCNASDNIENQQYKLLCV